MILPSGVQFYLGQMQFLAEFLFLLVVQWQELPWGRERTEPGVFSEWERAFVGMGLHRLENRQTFAGAKKVS